MARDKQISWTVSQDDLQFSPLGYAVELGENDLVSPVSARHSTFSRLGEFEVSLLGNDQFEEFPFNGITNATTSTKVRMLLKGENPTSNLIVANGSFVYKFSLDCSVLMAYRKVCENNSYFIDSLSCDRLGRTWVKDTGGIITVLDRNLDILNTLRMTDNVFFATIDPFRDILWTIEEFKVRSYKTTDMTMIVNENLPFAVDYVQAWDISAPSGTLLLTVSGDITSALSVNLDGSILQFSDGATGICQWGATGALVCRPDAGLVEYFNGVTIHDHTHGASFGVPAPTRIASVGYGCSLVSGSAGDICKIDSNRHLVWSMTSPWTTTDIKTTVSKEEHGRVFYLTSSYGIMSFRDTPSESWAYGRTDTPLATTHSYPLVAVIPPLETAHIWAKVSAIGSDSVPQRESSSSSSEP